MINKKTESSNKWIYKCWIILKIDNVKSLVKQLFEGKENGRKRYCV